MYVSLLTTHLFIFRDKKEIIIYEVYGCFCSPECACAYLNKEHIDSSTFWERYALLNNIYGKIYEHDENIKPAPMIPIIHWINIMEI